MSDPDTSLMRSERFDLRALYETSRLLSTSLDLKFVLNSLLLTVMSKLLTTRAAVLMRDPVENGYRVAATRNIKTLREGVVLEIPDIPEDAVRTGAEAPEALRAHGLELAAPVRFGNRDIGLLAAGRKATGEPYDPFELEFVRSLVHMSSTAVHNSLMVEELQLANRDLDARIQELNTLFDLSQEFNAAIDRERLVKLLSFALMGQMLVSRHMFLVRRTRTNDATDPADMFVAASGSLSDQMPPALAQHLCTLEGLLLPDDEATHSDGARKGLQDLGLILALPLKNQGQPCGALCLGPKRSGQPYTPADIEFLSALGHLTLVSVQNSFLVEEQIEKKRMEEEMRIARRIQERLLPRETPGTDPYEVAALAKPSRVVGGDYYDVVRLKGDRLLLAIADVTGKGMPAALLMANLQASLHVVLPMEMTIEQAVGHINRVTCENTDTDRFITFFMAILHLDSGYMEYVNAGHNPPLVVRRNGSMELLCSGGMLLGVMDRTGYERGGIRLEPGDVAILFTDGVTEAMSPSGEEYNEDRLEAVLQRAHTESAADIVDIVQKDIAKFTGNVEELSDDLTMLVVKRTAETEPPA